MKGRYFTSESVTEGHPDKVADRISDAVLDSVIEQDPQGRVACETFVSTGLVLVGGEITTETYVDIPTVARNTVLDVGYNNNKYGFDGEDCAVLTSIDEQSPDISRGVSKAREVREGKDKKNHYDELGAGDQGIVYGYACKETRSYMPLPITLAHRLTKKLAEARKTNQITSLRPDGKSQVTIEYEEREPVRADTVILAAQHDPELDEESLAQKLIDKVIQPVIGRWLDEDTDIFVNSSGKFVKGGPPADTGMTGRKIIVDTYGGYGSHGGGAYSGKDPTKVDRSGSYMARYIAKNIVASEVSEECEVQIAYTIGKANPLAVTIDTFGTSNLRDDRIVEAVEDLFDMRPAAIIDKFQLRRPIYTPLSAYGHFGREDLGLAWEKTDRKEELREKLL
ncbi:MAG: methionine adenosyltransferase [Candidatus Bipolaricaulota bacterium]|nr:methionine adenosyltransferase [Candidatus Bipolaricaulota bacterium]MBS3791304.1 methionine adenosyltransferase [Candidatus Bipolaricaulota bacterium]